MPSRAALIPADPVVAAPPAPDLTPVPAAHSVTAPARRWRRSVRLCLGFLLLGLAAPLASIAAFGTTKAASSQHPTGHAPHDGPSTHQFVFIDPGAAETGPPYLLTGVDWLTATDPLGAPWYDDPNLPRYLMSVQSQKFRNIINGEYKAAPRGGVPIGDGGAADMLRAEAADAVKGENWNGQLSSLGHYQKIDDDLRGVQGVIDNPLSSQPDVQAGRRFAGNLENALQEAQAASKAALSDTSQYMADQLHLESQIASSAAAIGNVEGEQMATAELGALEAEDEAP
jgi:hypothetical protein